MGFQPWVPQQDTNTEIRVAMLLSLSLQIALIFLGPMRKRSSFPRFIVWSCYLLADWVADLALGLLLNNMGNIGSGGTSSPIIFAFWTPFLLLHLGGPDTITAYSIEDNELWLRHLIGLLFELFSAIVIFVCSLHGNPMIHATVLMFIVGIIKYGERTYSLYSGSIKRFRANILGPGNPGRNYARFMNEFSSRKNSSLLVEIAIANGEALKVQTLAEQEDIQRLMLNEIDIESRAYDFFLIFRRLFVDLILSFTQRRMSQAFFVERGDLDPSKALEIIELELNFIYDMVYTKAPVVYTRPGWVLRSICSGCIVSALVIFYLHDKSDINGVDVRITYALLLGGLALDVAALAMLLLSDRTAVFLQKSRRFKWLKQLSRVAKPLRGQRHWSELGAQFNLMSYALGKPHHYKDRCFLGVAKMLRAQEFLEDLIFVRHVPLKESGTFKALFQGVRKAATKLRCKAEIVMLFNSRGKYVIEHNYARITRALKSTLHEDHKKSELINEAVEEKFKLIRDSVVDETTDFDESLLLWHIATDLCLCRERQVTGSGEWVWLSGAPRRDTARMRDISVTLSEYMMYLLIKQPEMLSARSGIWLMRYQDTCAEAQQFFRSMDSWIYSHDDIRRALLGVNTSARPVDVKGSESKSVLFDACILAKALRDLDEELMWTVVMKVWREMLTYAARKCPGSTHVRQLNRGGEFITLIWFLMEHMGLGDAYRSEEGDARAKILVVDQ